MDKKKAQKKLEPATAREEVFQQFAQLLRITQVELDRLENGDRKLSASALQAVLSVHRNALELISAAESHEIQKQEEMERAQNENMTEEEKELLESFQATFEGPDNYKDPNDIMKGNLSFDTVDAAKERSRYPGGK